MTTRDTVLEAVSATVTSARLHTDHPVDGTRNTVTASATVRLRRDGEVLRGVATWPEFVGRARCVWVSLWAGGEYADAARLTPSVLAEPGDEVTVDIAWVVE